jgi:hypothetical protein
MRHHHNLRQIRRGIQRHIFRRKAAAGIRARRAGQPRVLFEWSVRVGDGAGVQAAGEIGTGQNSR